MHLSPFIKGKLSSLTGISFEFQCISPSLKQKLFTQLCLAANVGTFTWVILNRCTPWLYQNSQGDSFNLHGIRFHNENKWNSFLHHIFAYKMVTNFGASFLGPSRDLYMYNVWTRSYTSSSSADLITSTTRRGIARAICWQPWWVSLHEDIQRNLML